MKIISHRGNLYGAISKSENSPRHIIQAINAGFDVEVDVWCVGGDLYLGHDEPTYRIGNDWVLEKPLWLHTKNQEAFEFLYEMSKNQQNMQYFWHENDSMTMTSQGTPWLFPGNYSRLGITVELGMPTISRDIYGVCTDYPIAWMR